MNYDNPIISRSHLNKAKPENLVRLAKALKINVDGMSQRAIVGLVAWRLAQPRARFADTNKRVEYEAMWEGLK